MQIMLYTYVYIAAYTYYTQHNGHAACTCVLHAYLYTDK